MKTQADMRVRVVAVSNLEAMCERVSGMAHRYAVSKVSRSRVHVQYSNPDEWAGDHPVEAVFPCYPNGFEQDNPYVALFILRTIGGDGETWQSFAVLLDCPQLWRSGAEADDWATREEIGARK